MKIATWNINSIRLRLDLLKKLKEDYSIDILCLQETKVQDHEFPKSFIYDLGFEYIYYNGEKSYNGVAILSKFPLSNSKTMKFINNDARHISAEFRDIEIHNFYIPAGGDETNITLNPKFLHKLDYCDAIYGWFLDNRKISDKMILLGDLNIAPLEHDVWSHKQLLKVISHTPVEIEKLSNIYESLKWIDAARMFTSSDKKLYSWWSYRNRDWKKSNRGRRLDHIWTSNNLYNNIRNCYILKEVRDWQRPSDHVPVLMEIDIK